MGKLATVTPINNSEFFHSLDAMENIVASLGTAADPRMYTRYREKYLLSRTELESMYVENWLAGKIVDVIPQDMTREWRTILTSEEPEKVKEFEEFEQEIGVPDKFFEASKWARLYGGCGIVMGIDPAQGFEMEVPLIIDTLGVGALTHLTVIEAERLNHAGTPLINDPTNPDFGKPEFYRIANTAEMVHRSRILFFNGLELPYHLRIRQRLAFWGAPVIQRVMEAITNSDLGVNGVASLMAEASVDIIKYKGLTAFLTQPGGEDKIRKRFALMKLLKSINNMTLLDSEEDFETHSQTFAGLGELIDKFLALVAGASDIPVTRLVGTSAKGLNATGEGDLKNYYDNIRARQNREYNPQLRRLDRVMQRTLWGGEPDTWSFKWDSLFQLTEEQIAVMENARADRDIKYLTNGVIDELVVASQLFEEGTYGNIDQKFLDDLKKLLDKLKKDKEENKFNAPIPGQPGVKPPDPNNPPDPNDTVDPNDPVDQPDEKDDA